MEVVGAIVALVSAGLGAVFTYWVTIKLEDRKEKRQAKRARTLASLEINQNLESLRGLWPRVTQINDKIQDPDKRKVFFARNLAHLPFWWKQEVLRSQLSFLPVSLSVRELKQVLGIYDDFRKLEATRRQLVLADQAQREEELAAVDPNRSGLMGPILRYYPPTPFNQMAASVWDECDSIANELLAEGNPLG